jgi:hypothetical protein
MKTIFLALQEPISRNWFPVARVDQLKENFLLRYTKGTSRFADFSGFGRMTKLDAAYLSDQLFPLLKNRVMARNRADFSAFAGWLGKDAELLTPFEELAVTGGLRGTDTMELIPVPEVSDSGAYEAAFFIHGVRYLSEGSQTEFSKLKPGDELLLVKDSQNPSDRHALLLRTKTSACLVGYVPRYFSLEFTTLLDAQEDLLRVQVARVNSDAPLAFKVLCSLRAPWPDGFSSCHQAEFELLTEPASQIQVVS